MKAPAIILGAALLAAGCNSQPDVTRSPSATTSATLDEDIVYSADVKLVVRSDDTLDATLSLAHGYGVAPDGTALTGNGRVERFPETDLLLYTARFDVPAQSGGPCGDKPVSLALSLHRRGPNARVSGSVTPYCGASTWFGAPARSPLRLAGDLPVPALPAAK